MNKKIIFIILIFCISIYTVCAQIENDQAPEGYESWEDWARDADYIQLAQNPTKAKEYWSFVDFFNKEQLFTNSFESFRDKADDYFTVTYGKKVSRLGITSGVSYSNGVLRSGDAILDQNHFPADAVEAIAVEDGFIFVYDNGNEIKLLDGSITSDNKLDDGSQIVFSEENQKVTIEKDKITLSKGASLVSDSYSVTVQKDAVEGTVTVDTIGLVAGEHVTAELKKDGEVEKIINGKFRKKGDAIVIESFDGKQSTFEDIPANINVQAVGYHLVIIKKGQDIPAEFQDFGGLVAYDEGSFTSFGAFYLEQDDINFYSKENPITDVDRFRGEFLIINDIISGAQTGDQVALDWLNDPEAKSFLESPFAFHNNEQDYAFGKVIVDDSGINYKGLTDFTQFNRQFDGNTEFVRIDGAEDGNLAIFTRKVKAADLLLETGFVSGEGGVTALIYKTEEEISLNLDATTLGLLAEIEKDPTKFLLIDKNLELELGDEQAYLNINTELGIVYKLSEEDFVTSLSPRNTQIYLGNDLDTLKGIVTIQSKSDEPFEIQLLSLQKIYSLERSSQITTTDADEEIQFEASIQSFDNVKEFIEDTYSNELQRSVALTSFMINNLDGIKQDYIWSGEGKTGTFAPDASQEQAYDSFVENTLSEIKENLEAQEFTDYGEELDSLYQSLYQTALSNPEIESSQVKGLFEQQFQNRIIYEALAKNYYTDYEADGDAVIGSYRALIALEETTISGTTDNLNLERTTSAFSTRKLNLARLLAVEYTRQDRLSDALVVMDQIKNDYNLYIDNLNSEGFDFLDPSNMEVVNALQGLRQRFIDDRIAIAQSGFNKIQFDLYTQADEIEKVFEARKGYTERVADTRTGLAKLATVVFSGGFGKDIVNLAGGFDDVKKAASDLETENQAYSKGVYGVQSLYGMGVPADLIVDWINDELTIENKRDLVNKLIVDSGRSNPNPRSSIEFPGMEIDDNGILTGRTIVTVDGNSHAINPEEQRIVSGFLEEVRPDSEFTYNSYAYGSDIKDLMGVTTLQSDVGSYLASEKMDIDTNLQMAMFESRIKELELSEIGEWLSFIDDGLSPGVIAISATTGGFGGTLFSSATGLTGAGLAIAENIFIDAAAGTLLIGSDISPEEHPYLTTGVSFGVAALTGIPRTLTGIAKKQITNADEFAESIARVSTDDLASVDLRRTTQGIFDENGILISNSDELQTHFDNFQTRRIEQLQSNKYKGARDAIDRNNMLLDFEDDLQGIQVLRRDKLAETIHQETSLREDQLRNILAKLSDDDISDPAILRQTISDQLQIFPPDIEDMTTAIRNAKEVIQETEAQILGRAQRAVPEGWSSKQEFNDMLPNLQKIGEGADGDVYIVTEDYLNTELGGDQVLKVLAQQNAFKEHANLQRLYDLGVSQKPGKLVKVQNSPEWYFYSERVDGETLTNVFRESGSWDQTIWENSFQYRGETVPPLKELLKKKTDILAEKGIKVQDIQNLNNEMLRKNMNGEWEVLIIDTGRISDVTVDEATRFYARKFDEIKINGKRNQEGIENLLGIK